MGFVALGALLRLGHYLTHYPLWGDEAFLAVNFVRRGYLDLLLPLEYGQICPILFLWAELTAVKLFGFSEWSLRLCPLICGIASVFLFRHVAGRMLKGPAVLMAVAIFAVSLHPIRHSADAKAYASDLLMALALLALAIEWCGSPQCVRWLWLLAGFAPLALAASYPAVFVAVGIALALCPSVWRTRRPGPMLALGAYVVVVATSLVALRVVHTHHQQGAVIMAALQSYWADSFPPLDSPARLARWLITTHAGSMFAYPWGGSRGASSGTLILVVIAAVVLWRRRQRTVLGLLVLPMGVALAAAALRFYPYGVQARVMQYIAPAVCLLAGLGLSTLLGLLPRPTTRAAATRLAAITLAVVGTGTVLDGLRHPYRAVYDHQAREFARRFWAEWSQGAELACPHRDFGAPQRRGAGPRTALFLCNQYIYAPSRGAERGPRWSKITPERPLRCVVFDNAQIHSAEAAAWLESMKERFTLRDRRDLVVPTTGLNMQPWDDHIVIYEFEPRPTEPMERMAVDPARERTAR
jgi:hypothetical protein